MYSIGEITFSLFSLLLFLRYKIKHDFCRERLNIFIFKKFNEHLRVVENILYGTTSSTFILSLSKYFSVFFHISATILKFLKDIDSFSFDLDA